MYSGRRRGARSSYSALAALPGLVVVFAAACGLDVVGLPLSGPGSSGVVDSGIATTAGDASGDASGDAGGADGAVLDSGGPDAIAPGDGGGSTFCERVRAADDRVTRCLDFEGATPPPSPFGFDDLTIKAEPVRTTLEVSPSTVFGEGRSFRAGFEEYLPAGTRDLMGNLRVLDSATYGANKSVSLEVDVLVETFTTTYAALAMIQVLGPACSDEIGFAINGTSFVDPASPASSFATFRVGTPYRLGVVFRPNTTPPSSELFIDGTSVRQRNTDGSTTCRDAVVKIGTFFTGGEGRSVFARFDNLTLRTIP